ncbi:MAG: TolC family protein [Kiritimatiellae bacterium]|nr:TolC family protein [Kiritimatiellia bacterium]
MPQLAVVSNAAPAYTLTDCIRMGLDRSLSLQNKMRDQAIAESKIKEVRSQLLPGILASAGYNRLDEAPILEDTQGSHDQYSASAGLSQLLYSGGSVSAALKAAREYRRYALYDTEQRNNAIIRDITTSFYDLLYTADALRVAQESLDQWKRFEEQTQVKFQNGTSSEFDLLSAQVKVANEKPQVIAAQNQHDLARERFKNLIYEDDTDFTVQGELRYDPVHVELELLYRLALENRPELQSMQSLIGMQMQDIRATQGEYFPRLYATASYQGSNPPSDAPVDDEWKWHWNAGLALSWDILDGGLRSSQVAQKKLAVENSRSDQIDLVRAIKLEVNSAYLTLMHSREVVLGAKDSVHLAQKAMDIADVRYKNGLFTYLEYTDSNLSLTQAKLIHYQALKAYMQAVAQLQYACGTENLTRD